ncbi:MAG: hypothetical protein IT359_18720 [Gemmatimonadaceae bacterium]|nr:hypothetical protein [Gemmatimonadaceae bacterium]
MPVSSSFTRRAAMAAIVTLALSATACAVITGTDERWDEQGDLSRARRTWLAQSITDYEYVARFDCYCLLGGVAVRVTVLDDRVVSAEIDGTSTPIPTSTNSGYTTIDGLFAGLQYAIDRPAWELDARYDPHYGFPTEYWIDQDRYIADDEVRYVLLRFRSLMR